MIKLKFLSFVCIILLCLVFCVGCTVKKQISIETGDVWSETAERSESSDTTHSQNQSRALISDFYMLIETTDASMQDQKKLENVEMLKNCLDRAKSYYKGSFDEDNYIIYIYKVLVEINRLYMQNGSEHELIMAADELDAATANLSREMAAVLKTVTSETVIETGKSFAQYGTNIAK